MCYLSLCVLCGMMLASIFHRVVSACMVMCVSSSFNKCTAVRITITELCKLAATVAQRCLVGLITGLHCSWAPISAMQSRAGHLIAPCCWTHGTHHAIWWIVETHVPARLPSVIIYPVIYMKQEVECNVTVAVRISALVNLIFKVATTWVFRDKQIL